MSSSHKVFILEKPHRTGEYCVADLKTLLSSRTIFPAGVDVVTTDFKNMNTDGLEQATFAIPGGSSIRIREFAKPIFSTQFKEKYNFIGICAGGFLAPKSADCFRLHQKRDIWDNLYSWPEYEFSFSDNEEYNNGNLNLIKDYSAIGPFEPDYTYLGTANKSYMPYCLELPLTQKPQKVLRQLYIAGPGFIPIAGAEEKYPCEVAATYKGKEYFMFFYPDRETEVVIHPSLAAIISSPANETRGARFLSGTHIEACVEDSILLKNVKDESKDTVGVPKAKYDDFLEHREETYNETVEILGNLFRPK
jgi:glutamine amidotransferase-like uncharacterized protein